MLTADSTLRAIADRAKTMIDHPAHTIVPPAARGELPAKASGLLIGATLGQGGMGIVRRATQLALGRQVATKSLRPELTDERSRLKLLREAWVTAALEHPNVVPIYDLELDADGRPIIVLKQIEGTSWSDLVGDAAEVARRFGATDLLEWNLRVLIQVANAVHFAHSRGIVHRDLKPENVMIGAFGEVYVLDWGIAVSVHDDGSGRLPLAVDATELAGTPHYMAPEMLGGARITTASDVYLLGATLYHAVCGAAPHAGADMMGVITRVALSEPALPPHVPDELARIITVAMARLPADRHPDARTFREALEHFLRHRAAHQIVDRGRERLAALRGAIEWDSDAHLIQSAFNDCRFAFQTALDAWPDSEPAKDGLDEARRVMIEATLGDDPAAASAHYDALFEKDAELGARIERALREKRADDARRESLIAAGRDRDPNVGALTRAVVGATLSLAWLLSHLVLGFFPSWTDDGYELLIAVSIVGVLLVLGASIWARESLLASSRNRTLGGVVFFGAVAHLAMYTAGHALDVSPIATSIYGNLLWAAASAMAGVAVESRGFFALAGAFAAAAAWSIAFPEQRFFATVAALGAFYVVMTHLALSRYRAVNRSTAASLDARPHHPNPRDLSPN